MDISGEYRLKVSRQRAWDTLLDPNTLHSCIPGCQSLERLTDDHYQARIKTVIGPVRATFDTELHIKNSNPPESYRLEGEGKGGVVGFGKGYADVTLNEDGEGTILRYSATFQVGGRLAQLGSRLVLGVTRKIAADFFDQLTKRIDSEAKRLDQVSPPMTGHIFSIAAIVMLVAVVLIWWLGGSR